MHTKTGLRRENGRPAAAVAELVSADGLTGRERPFCLRYVANGFKASAAYKAVAPAATDATARSESSRWLD